MNEPKQRSTTELKYLLDGRWFNFEIGGYIASEDTRFQGFDVSTNIRLRSQEMSFISVRIHFFMSVGHDDLSAVRLHLTRRK